MRQVHENARISTMKTALDTDLNPTIVCVCVFGGGWG